MTSPQALVALPAQSSPEVTQWPQRLLLTALVLGFVALVCWGMWRGWRARARRQADLPAPAEPPTDFGAVAARAEGRYVATVRADQWLDRIVAHGLGAPAAGELLVGPAGVLVERDGAPALFVPAADIVLATTGTGMAGDVVEREGLAVIRWTLGEAQLDTGFRARSAEQQREVVAAAAALAGSPTGGSV